MPLARSQSLHQSKKQLPQINETKQVERRPLATSPIVNSLKNSESVQNLSITDCSCPICLEVLIEPVVLPCKHELCLPCFKDMMDQTNFLCPMCRMRLSTWARSASKHNGLVDKQRWLQIQKQFSNEIKIRLEGKTAQILSEEIKKQKENQNAAASKSAASQHLSAQGEIQKEYEDYVKREQERIRLEKEKEESLSLKYIQEILQKEEACSLNDYLRVVQTKTPGLVQSQHQTQNQNKENLPTTSHTTNQLVIEIEPTTSIQASNQTQQHQPFITPSLPSRPNNRLLNRVKSSLGVQTPSNTNDSSSNATPTYSLRSRVSIKRNIDEVTTIRSNLINSINKENENNVNNSTSDDQPSSKRVLRSKSTRNVSNSSSDSISLNGSDISVDNTNEVSHPQIMDVDSKRPVSAVTSTLTRRRSVRTNKK